MRKARTRFRICISWYLDHDGGIIASPPDLRLRNPELVNSIGNNFPGHGSWRPAALPESGDALTFVPKIPCLLKHNRHSSGLDPTPIVESDLRRSFRSMISFPVEILQFRKHFPLVPERSNTADKSPFFPDTSVL